MTTSPLNDSSVGRRRNAPDAVRQLADIERMVREAKDPRDGGVGRGNVWLSYEYDYDQGEWVWETEVMVTRPPSAPSMSGVGRLTP